MRFTIQGELTSRLQPPPPPPLQSVAEDLCLSIILSGGNRQRGRQRGAIDFLATTASERNRWLSALFLFLAHYRGEAPQGGDLQRWLDTKLASPLDAQLDSQIVRKENPHEKPSRLGLRALRRKVVELGSGSNTQTASQASRHSVGETSAASDDLSCVAIMLALQRENELLRLQVGLLLATSHSLLVISFLLLAIRYSLLAARCSLLAHILTSSCRFTVYLISTYLFLPTARLLTTYCLRRQYSAVEKVASSAIVQLHESGELILFPSRELL